MNTSKPPPKKGSSGEHPAVQEYRRKLDSIAEDTSLRELDDQLEKYLKTPLPPPPEPNQQ